LSAGFDPFFPFWALAFFTPPLPEAFEATCFFAAMMILLLVVGCVGCALGVGELLMDWWMVGGGCRWVDLIKSC
jgi:hypothetical protein